MKMYRTYRYFSSSIFVLDSQENQGSGNSVTSDVFVLEKALIKFYQAEMQR